VKLARVVAGAIALMQKAQTAREALSEFDDYVSLFTTSVLPKHCSETLRKERDWARRPSTALSEIHNQYSLATAHVVWVGICVQEQMRFLNHARNAGRLSEEAGMPCTSA